MNQTIPINPSQYDLFYSRCCATKTNTTWLYLFNENGEGRNYKLYKSGDELYFKMKTHQGWQVVTLQRLSPQ